MTNIHEYSKTVSERQFRSSIGYSKVEFENLYNDFELTFIELHGCDYPTYILENVTEEVKLPSLRSCLFFVLYQLKNDLVYDSLGLTFQMGGSTAHDNFKKYSELVKRALEKKRSIQNEVSKVLKNLKAT